MGDDFPVFQPAGVVSPGLGVNHFRGTDRFHTEGKGLCRNLANSQHRAVLGVVGMAAQIGDDITLGEYLSQSRDDL